MGSIKRDNESAAFNACIGRLMTALLLTFLATSSRADDTQRFDGKWATTVSCKTAKNAAGSSVRFVTEVKDGVLSGQQGTEGAPGFLRIDGKVTPDGIGRIYAKGRTGSNESVAERDIPAGTEYAYYIQAHFERATGSGNRVEGRACAFKFEKR